MDACNAWENSNARSFLVRLEICVIRQWRLSRQWGQSTKLHSFLRDYLDFEFMGSLVAEEDLISPVDSQNRCALSKAQTRSKSPSTYRKPCDICHAPNDVLVRCNIDDTSVWYFVCTKNCWKKVSGGVIDGSPHHLYYRYGGMWKNKHAGVSAKKPKPKQRVAVRDWQDHTSYVFNDKVTYEGKVWSCRRSHTSSVANVPGKGYGFWKEAE